MNASTLGLTNISYRTTETGTAPDKVKYQGMSYAYDATKTKASNVKLAISNIKGQVSTATPSAAFAKQYDTQTGSVYYNGKNASGVDTRYTTVGSAKKCTASYNKKQVSNDITGNFKDYVTTTSATAGTSKAVQVGRPSVSDYETANATLSAVQNAINQVSTQRSALGALQNRLEHTIANLDNVSENTQSAESRIRDTDMADEMVTYSKNNILAQAGQSMLAQANQSTQGVLSLLQ